MKAATDLLERRRSAGSTYSSSTSNSRYVDYTPSYTPSTDYNTERGRSTTRYTPMQPPTTSMASYRSSTGSMETGSGGPGSGSGQQTGSLWGLLDMAQSWILNHTSRRDRSEERSRYLLRKTSKQVWCDLYICNFGNFLTTSSLICKVRNAKVACLWTKQFQFIFLLNWRLLDFFLKIVWKFLLLHTYLKKYYYTLHIIYIKHAIKSKYMLLYVVHHWCDYMRW